MTRILAHDGVVKDVYLHADDSGTGSRPVVLIHGWPLSGEAWAHQVPVLTEAGYRVVTYDRRGFGRSDKPARGYGYDTLADDLQAVIESLDLWDVTLVGFSMGGGEVARYLARHGAGRVHSVVFAAAIPPFLAKVPGNPDGPLDLATQTQMTARLTANEKAFYDQFTKDFFSVDGELVVSEAERQAALKLTEQANKLAALEAMASFGNTDFRDDLTAVTVPALIIHGDGDGIVPFEGSGQRTHEAIPGSEVHRIAGGPHGINASHPEEFNRVLLEFLAT
jgi:pimeloyl-ACP methyl ester carboxylesterase